MDTVELENERQSVIEAVDTLRSEGFDEDGTAIQALINEAERLDETITSERQREMFKGESNHELL